MASSLSLLHRLALEEAAGASILLDAELRVVEFTSGAQALAGGPIVAGERVVQALCGSGDTRPIAEALSRREPAVAEVVRPSSQGERVISIRTSPLREGRDVVGHLLFLAPLGLADPAATEDHGILTASESMRKLLRDVRRVAASDTSVLIRGETGSGKELVARAVHEESARAKGPFRAINCAALPSHLLESELFGHVRGAFTGAVRDVLGHFRLAEGGTLFLDEVAELPLELQAKLLRVLQERTVLPIGGREPIPVDVRLVSATHRSLRAAVSDGRFRADLMYRVRVIPLFLPPLRERPRDVVLLAGRFVDELNQKQLPRKVERVAPGALRLLQAWHWPGNVRELQNAVEYAFVLGEGPVLTEAELPPELRHEEPGPAAVNTPAFDSSPRSDVPGPVEPPDAPQDDAQSASHSVRHQAPLNLPREAARVLRALDRAGGNREQAAASLGMSRTTLWRKLKQFGIES